jgi:cytoskeletal protein RodZ
MTDFTRKQLGSTGGLGERLRSSRELRQIPREIAAKKLKIRIEYLIAMEENRFDRLPAGLYGKNYIREYGELLKISKDEIKKWLDSNFETVNESNNPFSQKIVRKKEFIVFPKLIRNIILILIFSACLFYLGSYFKKIVSPPELNIYQPDKNLKISENFIEIKGESESEAEIKINGETILNNNNGFFYTTINLKKGVNNIIITAKKKYSQEASVLRQILVE